MNTRRILSILAAFFAAMLFTTTAAYAGNAHFIASGTSASTSGTSLVVKFKEAGLESGSVETVQVSAHLYAVYQCINGGGHNPSDPKKATIDSSVSTSGTFEAGKNGNLTGSLSVSAPSAGSVLSCPGGQKATLISVDWSNVVIDDLTSGAHLAL